MRLVYTSCFCRSVEARPQLTQQEHAGYESTCVFFMSELLCNQELLAIYLIAFKIIHCSESNDGQAQTAPVFESQRYTPDSNGMPVRRVNSS